jgi:hypothetical protein
VRAATTQLQTSTPKSPHFNLYNRQQEHDWAAGESAAWVRTDAIVHAIDEVWGDFDRSEASRGPSWIPRATRELLTTKPEQLAAFLRHHLAEEPAISLSVINGPAGPLFNVSMGGGAHRTHPFSILGLPWMNAKLCARIPPRWFDVASVIDTARGERVVRGWHMLLERGLLHGRIRYEGAFAVLDLDLDHALAPWLLGDAALASAYNTAYERVYPGALVELGIPAIALTGRKAWVQWLYS